MKKEAATLASTRPAVAAAIMLLFGCREQVPIAHRRASGEESVVCRAMSCEWGKRFAIGGVSADSLHLAADSLGNLVVAGAFTGELDLGHGPLTSATGATFLAYLGPSGYIQWSQKIGGKALVSSVALSATGATALAGTISHIVDFGGGPLVPQFEGVESPVVVLWGGGDESDVYRWGSVLAGTISSAPVVSFTPEGDVLVSVSIVAPKIVKPEDKAWHITRLAPVHGEQQWSRSIPSLFNHEVVHGADAHGNTYLAVPFNGTVEIDDTTWVSSGFHDIMLAKLDATGKTIGSTHLDRLGEGYSMSPNLGVHPDGQITIGLNRGYADPWTPTSFDVAHLNTKGELAWTKALPGPQPWTVDALTDSGGSILTHEHPFTALTLDNTGAQIACTVVDVPETEQNSPMRMIVNANGHVFVAAFLSPDFDFGCGTAPVGDLPSLVIAKLVP